jgi:hypothetical protein
MRRRAPLLPGRSRSRARRRPGGRAAPGAGGPVVRGSPDAAGRYYVLQFVDAWTSNFACVGR